MSGRCETCKHWGAEIPGGAEAFPFLTEDDGDGHRVCALTITHGYYTELPTVPVMAAYAEAYDGEPRGLWTLPTFGCVQWEAKE